MTLDEMEKTFCNRGFMGQEEAVLAVQLMPRMVKALRTLEWISEHRIIDCGRWTEAVMKSREALAELEQP